MKVFYDPAQNVVGNVSSSPSAGKPSQLLAYWQELGLPLEIVQPKPLSAEEISSAHDPDYVKKILSCQRANGVSNLLESVAKSLPWTSGSMVSAAWHAVTEKETTASLSSGFHHACYDSAGGFCTFNGLAIAAQLLKKRLGNVRVGILDCDVHYGNGTDNIIKKLGLIYIVHWTFGGEDISPGTADRWLADLPGILERFKDCQVILYQAGADPHIDDPLGGVLTSEQLRSRDQIVFEWAKRIGIPVAWNLAGGYQSPLQKVLDIHTATALMCLRIYEGYSGESK